jgi:hypothetical protein
LHVNLQIIMNKILVLIIVFIFQFFTQPVKAQKISILGGYNAAFIYSSWNGQEETSNKIKNGFRIGPIIEVPVLKSVMIKSGLLYTLKGSREYRSISEIPLEDDTRYNIFYLEWPLILKKEFRFARIPFFVEAGVYAACGTLIYVVTDGVNGNQLVHEYDKYGFKGKNNNWSTYRMDYGWTAGLGVEFKKITFGFSFEGGIRNIDAFPEYVLKNKVYSVYATYAICDKRKHF